MHIVIFQTLIFELTSNDVGVSATITLPVRQRRLASNSKRHYAWQNEYDNPVGGKLQHLQAEENNYNETHCDVLPIYQNIDNEEDEKVDCLNEEVESFFTSPSNQIHSQDPLQFRNR